MKNEELHSLVFETLGGCTWEYDLDGEHLRYSDEFYELIGYGSADSRIDTGWVADNIHPEDLPQWREAYVRSVKGESRYFDCELRFRHRQGHYVWIQTRGVVSERDPNGRATRIVGLVFDISERKVAKESESRYRLLLDNVPDAISLKDRDGRYLYINRRFESWIGKPSYAIYGQTADEIFHPQADTLDQLRAHESRVWEQGVTLSEERQFPLTRDGTVRHAQITKFPIYDEAGNILAIGTTNTDVTERFNAQQALRQSEQRYRQLFESAPVILIESDWTRGKQLVDRLRGEGVTDLRRHLLDHPELLRGRGEIMELLHINREALHLFRAQDERSLRAHLQRDLNPVQREALIEDLCIFAAGKRRSSVRTRGSRVDGEAFPAIRDSELHGVDADDWSLVLVTIRDDSAEEAVRQSEKRYRSLFQAAPVVLVETDWSRAKALIDALCAQGVTDLRRYLEDDTGLLRRRDEVIQVTNANEQALEVFGVDSVDEFIRLMSGEMSVEQRRSTIEDLVNFAAGTSHTLVHSESYRSDGTAFPIIRECERYGDDPDDWSQVLVTLRDVSMEETIRHNELRYRQLFELAPAVLAESDWTPGKRIIDDARALGVADLRQYLIDNPELTRYRGQIMKVTAVNREALRVYRAPDVESMVRHTEGEMNEVQRLGMIEDLVNFASGKRRSSIACRTFRLDGEEFPMIAESEFYGADPEDWSRILLTVRDTSVEETLRLNEQRYRMLFDFAPAVLCEIDLSPAKALLDGLRQSGIFDIRRHLGDHPELIRRQRDVMRVLSVNQEALRIFRAASVQQLIDYAEGELNDYQRQLLIDELCILARGQRRSVIEGRHTRLDGESFPVIRECELYSADPNDWSKAMLTLRDTSAEEAVRQSEVRYRRLFESAPVALYESDWSRGKALVDELRRQGVEDIETYLDRHPQLLRRRDEVLQIIDLNREALQTYGAPTKAALIEKIEGPIIDNQRETLKQTLAIFADGRRRASVRGMSRRFGGEEFPIVRNTELISSDREDWSRVLSSIQDLTEEVETANRLRDYQQELRLLAGKISAAEESERRRISSELHDGTIQNLVLARIQLAGLKNLLQAAPDQELADSINQLLEDSLRETRSLIFEISPPVLYELGLEPAVEWLAEHYRQRTGVAVTITSDEQQARLSQDMNIVLFQAARELLVNISKHARAQRVSIEWQYCEDRIRLVIEDDGIGFDVENAGVKKATEGGFGLFALRERLKLLGADLQLDSSPRGTRATITAPLELEQKIA